MRLNQKRLLLFKSINPDYEDIKVKDLIVIGEVTGVFNKI